MTHLLSPARLAGAIAVLLLQATAVAEDVPVDGDGAWEALSFRGIPASTVSHADGALHIAVDRSASPVVYAFDEPRQVRGVTLRARWQGALSLPPGATQGERGADDFVLKLGLIEAGERRLNWFQRRVAAPWVRRLFELAPSDSGLDRVRFLSTTQQPALLGSSRVHPLDDLLYEERVTLLEAPGEFTIERRFETPVELLGLWLSADGDDTGSTFDVYVERITLDPAAP